MTSDAHLSSLHDVHRSVRIPGTRWRQMFAFIGPAYMIAVGYMDPGNWATDIAAGSLFGYRLLWILLVSNLMALLLQTLSSRLGLVTGQDLAQACRDSYGPVVRWILFVLCEIAIAACDLAEVLGTAIGLNLLFGIPVIYAVLITGLDVLMLLAIQRLGIRKMEAFIVSLVLMVGLCFVVEIFLSKPSIGGIASGLIPGALPGEMLVLAIGILGATVMPHNLYLHSALVQSRDVARDDAGIARAAKYNFLDSAIALNAAFFVNAAILIVAAATFFAHGQQVTEIQQAHQMLDELLGSKIAPAAFAIALICAGQSSTITGTLAGQVTMEGFLQFRMQPWLRRLITRGVAIIPAVIVISIAGQAGSYKLLILSQVILSLQLPFAVVPLVKFTSNRHRMGPFANPWIITIFAWIIAAIVVGLNAALVYQQIAEWSQFAGEYRALVLCTAIPLAAALGILLLWMTFKPQHGPAIDAARADANTVMKALDAPTRRIARIGVALEAFATDAPMLREAVRVAQANQAELVLINVIGGVGGQYHGARASDNERRHVDSYMDGLVARLKNDPASGVQNVRAVLGYGNIRAELIRIAKNEMLDLLIVGGHGHRGISDLIRGTTIDAVRHNLAIPVLAVRS